MSIYDFWIDGSGMVHRISEMPDSYIENCLKQIEKMGHSWGMYTIDDLREEELMEMTKTGTKAWYVINARKYVDAFEIELAAREAVE